MKLRQKLAMVLAAAMVVTAVPVTTMAASTNGFNKTLSLVEGTKVTSDSELFLKMDFNENAQDEVFFLDAVDFEFSADEYKLVANKDLQDLKDAVHAAQAVVDAAGDKATDAQKDALKAAKDAYNTALEDASKTVTIDGLEITVLSSSQVKVKVLGTNEKVSVPVYGKAKKGTPAIVVDGSDSLATSGKYAISGGEIVTDKALTATVDGDPVNISVDGKGEIGSIKIEEAVAGSLAGQTITIELGRKSDLKFASKQNFEVKGLRGLATDSNIVIPEENVTFDNDHETIKIKFPSTVSAKTRGAVVIKGLDVVPQDSRNGAEVGKVEVTVKGKKIADTDLHVANISEFGHELKVKEEVELTAGKGTKKVEIQFNELAAGSINAKRDVFFTIKGATVKDFAKKEFKKDDKVVATLTYDAKEEEFQLSFTKEFDESVINKFAFEVELYADVDYTGDITVTATSRDFEDKEVKAGTVVASTTATAKEAVVKVGLNGQVAGEIKLTEEKAGTFARNKEVIVKLDTDARVDGIKVRDAKVEVAEGDVEIDEDSIEITKEGEIRFTIKRESDEASTIKISEIELDVTRVTPEGSYGVVIGGAAISDRNEKEDKDTTTKVDDRLADTIEVEKFVVVGTKNTEDLPDAAKAKEIVLTVGSPAYTVNGEAKTADAAAFIDASNRTMVPVRFVAEEFGKVDFGTINGVGTVTIFKDGAVLQFQNGSNIMNKNGINVPMDTQVVIKDGRTYVPFKYVADGLGIGYSFDAATKSITFTNQVK